MTHILNKIGTDITDSKFNLHDERSNIEDKEERNLYTNK